MYLEPSLRIDDFRAPPMFAPAAEAAAGREAARLRGPWERMLFVHPETGAERTWEPARFAWVIERFLAERPDYMAVVSSLAPIDYEWRGGRVKRIDLHLELTLALVRHADLFLGVDSCFLHAADLNRVPGVALFGPTKSWQWGFRFSRRSRDISAESMDAIGPEPVLEALLDVVDARRTPASCESPCFTPTR